MNTVLSKQEPEHNLELIIVRILLRVRVPDWGWCCIGGYVMRIGKKTCHFRISLLGLLIYKLGTFGRCEVIGHNNEAPERPERGEQQRKSWMCSLRWTSTKLVWDCIHTLTGLWFRISRSLEIILFELNVRCHLFPGFLRGTLMIRLWVREAHRC